MEMTDKLHSHGLRATQTRRMVLSALESANTPLTAEDIVQLLGDDVSMATIYRALSTFAAHGIVLQEITHDGVSNYSLPHIPHHHELRCTRCDKTIGIESCPLQEFEGRVAETTGYRITGHNLELHGICPTCQQSCCG